MTVDVDMTVVFSGATSCNWSMAWAGEAAPGSALTDYESGRLS